MTIFDIYAPQSQMNFGVTTNLPYSNAIVSQIEKIMSKIDILMSVYNCERYINDTINSILNQTFTDFRVIIVDDGSSDRTGDICKQFVAKDRRVEYYHQGNAGIVAALNHGLQYCSAPFIARHDGDDISYPDRFEKELTYLEANPDCVAVSSVARHIDENGIPCGTISTRKDISAADCWSIPAAEPYLLQPMLMMRRTALDTAGGYRNLSVAEDADLMWRLNRIGSMHILPESLGDYRVHAGSVSSRSIVKGRFLAIWSQLAALSEQRRVSQLPDIVFSNLLLQHINTAISLKEMVDTIREQLTDTEFCWLCSAVSAKLLEFCYYRPYEPDKSDIQFIVTAVHTDRNISERPGYEIFKEAMLSAAIRSMQHFRIKDALSLIPFKQWPVLFGRIAFRTLIPKSTKKDIIKIFSFLSEHSNTFKRFANSVKPSPYSDMKNPINQS